MQFQEFPLTKHQGSKRQVHDPSFLHWKFKNFYIGNLTLNNLLGPEEEYLLRIEVKRKDLGTKLEYGRSRSPYLPFRIEVEREEMGTKLGYGRSLPERCLYF